MHRRLAVRVMEMHAGRRLALAGEVRLKTEVVSNPELDDSPDDSELVPEIFGILGFATAVCSYVVLAISSGLQDVGSREAARAPAR